MTMSLKKRTTSQMNTRRRGFTLVELTLGLLVTTFVAGAVGAFLLAVSRCWNGTANVQNGAIRASQFTARLAQRLQDAKRIGYWRDGSANNGGFIFWQGDTNADGEMQASEMGVVQFNAVDQTVDLCTLAGGAPDNVWTTADFKDSAAIDNFVAHASFTPLIRGVKTAMLTVTNEQSETVAPTVSWVLAFRQTDGSLSPQTCVAGMRAPATPP